MNKETKNMIRKSVGILLILAIVYLGSVGRAQVAEKKQLMTETIIERDTTKIKTKEDIDHTGAIGSQREMDSIDDYMRHWYEVLDTNSDGDIDGDYLEMDCGGKVHDTIIEWLEE